MADIVMIPIDHLHPHPDNPRREVGDVTELADSIRAKGILQNLTVVPMVLVDPDATISLGDDHYTIIIGHRRFAAAQLAGLTELPCSIVEMTDREMIQTMIVENMQRTDLTVYEQAQGFQMMLDLGSPVEEIAEKTGFSVKTVKRRVKMMELDQKKLQEVSSRQLSLADFDTLAQIEDIKERNKCLEKIGTHDFDNAVTYAMRRQNVKKNKPLIKAWLKEHSAIKLESKDTYGGKYEEYGSGDSWASYIYLYDWAETQKKLPKIVKDKQLYYVMDDDSIRLYQKPVKKKAEKKPPAVLAREKAIREAWKALEETQSVAFDLRKQFVEKLMVTNKTQPRILQGAIYAICLDSVEYNSPDRTAMYRNLGMDDSLSWSKRTENFKERIALVKEDAFAQLIYAAFGDSEKEGCTGTCGKGNFPKYTLSIKLNLLYEWLVSLGYEMSTEEMQMLNGELDAYKAGEEYGKV